MTPVNIEVWSSRIDNVTSTVGQLTKGLSYDELNTSPNSNSWSIAQVLEHLIVVGRSYYPIFDRVLADEYKPPWTASLPFLSTWLGKMILRSVRPENRRKTRTFPVWQPETGSIEPSVVDLFNKSQSALKDYMSKLANRNIIVNSPASDSIVYSLEDAFEIIVTHEERHLDQIQRVHEELKSRSL